VARTREKEKREKGEKRTEVEEEAKRAAAPGERQK